MCNFNNFNYIALYSLKKSRGKKSLVSKAPMPMAMPRHMVAAPLPAGAAPFAFCGLLRRLQHSHPQAKMPKIAKRGALTLFFRPQPLAAALPNAFTTTIIPGVFLRFAIATFFGPHCPAKHWLGQQMGCFAFVAIGCGCIADRCCKRATVLRHTTTCYGCNGSA